MKLIKFEKKLGLLSAIAITVGGVVGVGIFVIVGPMGANSGSFMPLAFVIASVPAFLGTLVAIALGSTIPADAGGFFYTKELFSIYPATVTSTLVIMGAIGAMMAVSVGVADYMRLYFPEAPRAGVTTAMIVLSWLVNVIGVSASVSFQVITVVQLISGILLVIISALIGGGHPDFSQPLPQGIPGFLQASVIAMLTYTGWNIIGEMGDEIENPRRNIPLTIIFGLGIVILLYVGIGFVVSGTLTPTEMKVSKVAVLDTALHYLPGWTMHYINLSAFAAAITSVNAVFLAVPRELYALSENGILPKWFMKYNPQRQNFPISIAVVAIAGALLSLLNFNPDIWGMFCVAGLLGANVIISLGTLRLFKRFPDKVANAPLKLKKSWVYPASILSALFSLAFAVMAFYFYKPVGPVFAIMILTTLFLALRSRKAD